MNIAEPLALEITVVDKYGPAMEIQSKEEADAYFMILVDHNMRCSARLINEAEKIERSNLGYYAGYYNAETRERVERLFQCTHPFFGAMAVEGQPLPEIALETGRALGAKRKSK